ncbi:MAG: selenocysteine-specific translation elongation factor, partial [Chloroflexota bacterium]
EEQERQMTIDLGFAFLTLPDGEEVGIVDVPGHRDFIENMLAGVGGIDAVLLVVAADEGVMPQTREHLAILDLLRVSSGVVVITKTDLVEDPDWLELVSDDVRKTLQGTVLEGAPIVHVSAIRHTGLGELLQSLSDGLQKSPLRPDFGRPRLPIDRVFTLSGFGTVVTGTLTDGRFKVGEEVEILPGGLKGRVRGLQSHKRNEDVAYPGTRTAMNISGVSVEQICRGEVIAHPGDYRPTRRLDVQYQHLRAASSPLKHDLEVKCFHGTAEIVGRVRLLGKKELRPGEDGWLQIELREPAVAVRGDRYILRRPSPPETIGGGVVVDPHPTGRHKRFSEAVLTRLQALLQGTPDEIVQQTLMALGVAPLEDLILQSNLNQEVAKQVAVEMEADGRLLALSTPLTPKTLVASPVYWQQIEDRVIQTLDRYHQERPLRRGMPRQELKSKLAFAASLYNALISHLVSKGELEEVDTLVALYGHQIRLTPDQQVQVEKLLSRFAVDPFSPPTVKECLQELGEELFNALMDLGVLVRVSEEVVFRGEDYERLRQDVVQWLQAHGTVTVAELRDSWGTSRRYVLSLLEHLDAEGITVREGDVRRLKSN